jgi:DNA primase
MNANSDMDLVALIENDLGQGKKSGRWLLFHCPFGHKRGDKKPSLTVTNGDHTRPPFWKCWSCGKQGGAVKWMMEKHELSYADALQALNIKPDPNRPRQEPPVPQPDTPPGPKWQVRAWELIERAEVALWDKRGEDALAWLLMRGLKETTICAAHIGYIPKDFTDKPEIWGTPGDDDRPLYFFEGILIPGIIGSTVWYLKMRPSHPRDGQKYKHARGGKQALYLADTLAPDQPAIFCEGELDARLLLQEVRDIASVITLASATTDINLATWGIYLLRPTSFILAHDMDKAGDDGAAKLSWLHDAQRLHIPALREGDKDITDYYLSGGDLHALIQETVKELSHAESR